MAEGLPWTSAEKSMRRSVELPEVVDFSAFQRTSETVRDSRMAELAERNTELSELWDPARFFDDPRALLALNDAKSFPENSKSTRENSVEMLTSVKKKLYESIGINESWENSGFAEFKRWFVDGLIGDNIELAKQLLENGVEELANALKSVLENVEKAMEFAKRVAENVEDDLKKKLEQLKSFDPYGYWNVIWWVWIGVLGWVMRGIWKGVLKSEIKTAEKEILRKISFEMSEYAEKLAKREVPKSASEAVSIISELRPMLTEMRARLEKTEKMDKIELWTMSGWMLDLKSALFNLEEKIADPAAKRAIRSFRTGDFQKTNEELSKFKK